MLKRLYVDNFRCFSNFELEPRQVSVLIGPNGGGKSTVLEVLRALQSLINHGVAVDEIFGDWSLSRWDTRLKQRFELEIDAQGRTYTYTLVVARQSIDDPPKIEEEKLVADGDLLYLLSNEQVELHADGERTVPRTRFPFNAERSFLPQLAVSRSNQSFQRLLGFKDWLSKVYLFRLNPWSIPPSSESEDHTINFDGSNVVSRLRVLFQESPEVHQQLIDDLEPVIEGLEALRLESLGPRTKVLTLSCRLEKPFSLFLNELSEGQRVLLVLYAILRDVASRAVMVVFDEPGNFIAQHEIQPWLAALRESLLVERDNGDACSLLVISHHPEIVDYLAADEAIYLWRNQGPTRLKRVEEELKLEDGVKASEWLAVEASGG